MIGGVADARGRAGQGRGLRGGHSWSRMTPICLDRGPPTTHVAESERQEEINVRGSVVGVRGSCHF